MKRNFQIIMTCFMLLLGTSLHLEGQTTFSPEPFDGIYVTGNIEVQLQEGTEDKVELYADGIPDDKIVVKVQRGILRLRTLESWLYKGEVIKAYITYKSINSIKGNAGASIECNNLIVAETFEARATSGARVELNLDVNSLKGGATEGGILVLEGKAEKQDVSVATGGQYEGLDLQCKRTYVRANTGGRAEVSAEELLDAAANTGGTIRYNGDPKDKNIKTVIAGEIDKI